MTKITEQKYRIRMIDGEWSDWRPVPAAGVPVPHGRGSCEVRPKQEVSMGEHYFPNQTAENWMDTDRDRDMIIKDVGAEPPQEILRMLADGQIIRAGMPIEELPAPELVCVIKELIALIERNFPILDPAC